MQPYFLEDGITLIYERADRWLAQGELFRTLNSASLERVIGQDVAPWMLASSTLRRLQNEMQMLLYAQALNDERAARSALTVNSFWVSGCGALDARAASESVAIAGADSAPVVVQSLALAAMQQDWQSWGRAWQALDANECAALLVALDESNSASLNTSRLSLCSENRSVDLLPAPASFLRTLKAWFKPLPLPGLWKQL